MRSTKLNATCKGHEEADHNPLDGSPAEGLLIQLDHFFKCVLFGWLKRR